MLEPLFDFAEWIICHEYLVQLYKLVGFATVLSLVLIAIIRLVISIWWWCKTPKFRWMGGPLTWAVVTGCTEGIGLAYAQQLYQKGYNLLLISRNQEKLDKVRLDIQTEYGFSRKVRTLAIDFSLQSEEIYKEIAEEFKELDRIDVVVNNVGTNYPNERPEFLTQIPDLKSFIMNMINVNIVACTRITAMVLPDMEQRKRGVIINLSSFSALLPTPLLTLYSATKVYVDFMSRALQEEYRAKGIIIQSVMPYYVSTRMSHHMQPSMFTPTPQKYVKSALKTVGKEDRTDGYVLHWVWNLFYWWLGVWSRIFGYDINIKFAYYRLRATRNRIIMKEGALLSEEAIVNHLEEEELV